MPGHGTSPIGRDVNLIPVPEIRFPVSRFLEISFLLIYTQRMISLDTEKIHQSLLRTDRPGPALLAIDGRCAAGKTTFAGKLAAEWGASLFHMDDFYLQPAQRTEERLAEPGGNVDRERFLAEVLLPLRKGQTVEYRRFDCVAFTFEPTRLVVPGKIAIVEGSYSCHPALRGFYDLRIFLDIDPAVQQERILRRNGPDGLERFNRLWIPMEESYFRECRVRECCDAVVTLPAEKKVSL